MAAPIRREQGQYYLLQRIAVVSGSDFRDAQPGRDENGRPDATFILTRAAGDRFYDFTSKNINKPMAVVLDNKVQEVANIQEAIRDQGRISGLGEQKAKDLSLMLRTGALPASIHYLEERTVGPSLGADSIRKGVTAAIIGMLAVMIFMLVYYKGAGINADLALFLNLVILLGFMGFAGATLTLAGHCGCDPDRRHGRGLECADLRAHPGRDSRGQSRRRRRWTRVSRTRGRRFWIRT